MCVSCWAAYNLHCALSTVRCFQHFAVHGSACVPRLKQPPACHSLVHWTLPEARTTTTLLSARHAVIPCVAYLAMPHQKLHLLSRLIQSCPDCIHRQSLLVQQLHDVTLVMWMSCVILRSLFATAVHVMRCSLHARPAQQSPLTLSWYYSRTSVVALWAGGAPTISSLQLVNGES